jgi:hypothetical protein
VDGHEWGKREEEGGRRKKSRGSRKVGGEIEKARMARIAAYS